MRDRHKQILIFPLVNFVNFFRRLFWRIFKPATIGVRLFLLVNKEIVLVKHSYLNQWFFPGGGVKAKETVEEALKRETKEEIGVDIKEKVQVLGVYSNFQEYKKDHIIVFFIEMPKKVKTIIAPQNFEIEDIRYFPLKNLPQNISLGTKKRIQEFLKRNSNEIFIKKW